MKIGGITKRWIRYSLSVTLAVVVFSGIAAVGGYYLYCKSIIEQEAARTAEQAREALASNVVKYDARSYREFAGAYAAEFPRKNEMEIWFLDKNGKFLVSSAAFPARDTDSIPEYEEALASDKLSAQWIGRFASGENIYALTTALNASDGTYCGAVRILISLRTFEVQMQTVTLIAAAFILLFLSIVCVTQILLVKSIEKPINDIGDTADRIAAGDLSARAKAGYYDDEITRLGKRINNLAAELSAADKMKNDFISTISHELRTPLTAIQGWGETLKNIGETDAALTQRGLDVITGEVTRLSGLVEELLDFSRLQSGRMNLNLEKIDVFAELDDAVFTFTERAAREGIELRYNAEHVPTAMQADANKIQQVFCNILDNAIKYTPQGGTITVRAEIVQGCRATISVSDSGRGIAPELLGKVKEKFFKADNAERGAGIGLAIADEIVKLHGGTLNIDSILGEGTTVTIELPVEEYIEESQV